MEIARALCTDPMLLLLDEPAAGLRLKEKQALAAVLRQLRDEGMAILLVEHDMDLVMGLDRPRGGDGVRHQADRGTPEEVQASPAVRAAYLGTEPRLTMSPDPRREPTCAPATAPAAAEVLDGPASNLRRRGQHRGRR